MADKFVDHVVLDHLRHARFNISLLATLASVSASSSPSPVHRVPVGRTPWRTNGESDHDHLTQNQSVLRPVLGFLGQEHTMIHYILRRSSTGSPSDETHWLPNKEMTKPCEVSDETSTNLFPHFQCQTLQCDTSTLNLRLGGSGPVA